MKRFTKKGLHLLLVAGFCIPTTMVLGMLNPGDSSSSSATFSSRRSTHASSSLPSQPLSVASYSREDAATPQDLRPSLDALNQNIGVFGEDLAALRESFGKLSDDPMLRLGRWVLGKKDAVSELLCWHFGPVVPIFTFFFVHHSYPEVKKFLNASRDEKRASLERVLNPLRTIPAFADITLDVLTDIVEKVTGFFASFPNLREDPQGEVKRFVEDTASGVMRAPLSSMLACFLSYLVATSDQWYGIAPVRRMHEAHVAPRFGQVKALASKLRAKLPGRRSTAVSSFSSDEEE